MADLIWATQPRFTITLLDTGLERQIPCEIVPGVSSALAVPAGAGIPGTHRGLASSVLITTGHEDPSKPESALRWPYLARAAETLVFLMGVARLPELVRSLIAHGRRPDEPAALIRSGWLPEQRTLVAPLEELPERAATERVGPPAVLVVGPVVGLGSLLQQTDQTDQTDAGRAGREMDAGPLAPASVREGVA